MSHLPDRIGPFRVLARLGSGVMGVVYRCKHVETGAAAAVKTVSTVQPEDVQAIRREILALQRIRHPGIVRILAEGLHEGLPWYAMELLEGMTLRRRIEELFGRPEPEALLLGTESLGGGVLRIEGPRTQPGKARAGARGSTAKPQAAGGRLKEMIELVRRLCEGLAFLHGEGLVQRDLKPDNVLIRVARSEREADSESDEPEADGRSLIAHRSSLIASCWPVLVDFGLAARFAAWTGREPLEAGGLVAGTTAYMAPEQLRGDLVDARADLYSLGCILYELLTGQPPFVGDSSMEVARAHLQDEPLPPSVLAEGIQPELDELASRLLQKRPRDRIGYADDVAAALARISGTEPASAATGAGLPEARARPRAYLYRPGLVGRTDELQELERHLDGLASGRGGLVLIGGESGVGKTRLAVEAAGSARRRRVRVLLSDSGGDGRLAAPLECLRGALQALADLCRDRSPEESRRLLGGRGKLLAAYEPALAGLPALAAEPEPVELPPEAARLRLFRTLAKSLEALAAETPVLLLLDDLHWADDLTLGLLDFLVRTGWLETRPVLVLGTYRSEETTEALRALAGHESCTALTLRRLDREAVAGIAADMLALEARPAALADFLARASEGNPLFVAEYLRLAVDAGLLWRDAAGRWQVAEPGERAADAAVFEALPLPAVLHELVARHLDGLTAGARRLAEAAAVLGREADGAVMAAVAGAGAAEVLDATLELLDRQVMEEAGRGRLRFTHDKLHAAAYGRIEDGTRCELHRRCAELLEERTSGPGELSAVALARHWQHAGSPEKARPWYLAAARQAVARYAYEEAGTLYRAYLRLVEHPELESIEARLELTRDVLAPLGRTTAAIEEQRSALSEARLRGDPRLEGRVLSDLADSYGMVGQVQTASRLLEDAIALHHRAADRAGLGLSLRRLGWLYHQKGRTAEAIELTRQAMELERESDSTQGLAAGLANMAVFHKVQGRLPEAQALYEEALSMYARNGDAAQGAKLSGRLALLHLEQGRLEAAQDLFETALEAARQAGYRRMEGQTLLGMGLVAFDRGLLAQARRLIEQSLEIQRQTGNRRGEGTAQMNLGVVLLDLGSLQEAERHLGRALTIHCELSNRRFEAATLCSLAEVWHQQDRRELALDGYEQALTLLREVGERRFAGHAQAALARLRFECGQVLEARELLGEALEIQRKLGERRFEAFALMGLARLRRLGEGRLQDAQELLDQAESNLRGIGSELALALTLAERVHLALALGRPRPEALQEAEALAGKQELEPDSLVVRDISRARKAHEASASGRLLFRGECVEDLPEGLRRWLIETSQLEAGAVPGPAASAGPRLWHGTRPAGS